jgi:hypothetical protein
MTNIESVIERINKLRALSKSDNVNEAASAAAAANKLIDQHRLSESELEREDFEKEIIIRDNTPLYECARITQWRATLTGVLAKHYSCAIYNSTGFRLNRYTLVGRKSDIDIVHYMYAWLSSEIERLSASASKGKNFDRSRGRVFAGSFSLGAVDGIGQQLNASRKEAAVDASATALVRLEARWAEADAFLHNTVDKLVKPKQKPVMVNLNAYDKGIITGKNLHLGAKLNQAQGVKLLGE